MFLDLKKHTENFSLYLKKIVEDLFDNQYLKKVNPFLFTGGKLARNRLLSLTNQKGRGNLTILTTPKNRSFV